MLHLTEPPPAPRTLAPDLSPELEALILKALAKKPEERYPTGAALAEALTEILLPKPDQTAAIPANAESKPDLARVQSAALPVVQPQVAEGKVVPTRYIIANIRALLLEWTEDFSEQQLRQLYIDLPDFRPVHRQLATIRGKIEIIDRLLEYAEQTLQLDELLTLAHEHNPAMYEKHQPYYELTSVARRDLAGQNLGKYRLVDRLGYGGMADVYKAYQAGLSRFVAIKIIHSHLADNEELLERFENEAMAVANLRHPNIVQVFDFDREDDLYYMAMEFVDGPTLETELKKYRQQNQPYPIEETLTIFQALGGAIDYAHSRGMIHRDLKPGNIMFTPRRRVVLTDFGIARFTDRPQFTVTNAVVGTPAYMSPEQAQGEPVDTRTDIFSLGVILYEMLTGRIPFEGDNPFAIVLKLVSDSWPRPRAIKPDLSPALEQVILKAMSKHPSDRYPTAGDLAQALQAAIELPPTPQLPVQSVEHLPLKVPPIPEIEIKTPPPVEKPPAFDSAGPIRQWVNGQNVIQLGYISGSQISIGPSAPAAPAPAPNPPAELVSLEQLLFRLKTRVEAEAPTAKQSAALERLAELEETLTALAPDLDVIVYIKNWFSKQIPPLTQAVNEVITHPLVSRRIAAAGEAIAVEYRRRFG
jgi:serine/threonine protein kinase